MTHPALRELYSLQTPDGSFPSEVNRAGWVYIDHNGYTTALVLRALRNEPSDPIVKRIRAASLDFIERCRSKQTPGAFGFWPETMRPDWVTPLPADIDDTSIMTVELLRYGRLSQREGLRVVCSVLLPHRVVGNPREYMPPWVTPGAFQTWIAPRAKPNVVDCCVNANAVALMAWVGAAHLPGFNEAISTILRGLDWAGTDLKRQRAITPFSPSLHALHEAVEHAVDCGVAPLVPALRYLEQIVLDSAEDDTQPGCCCSAYGSTIWHCQALEIARSIRRQRMQV